MTDYTIQVPVDEVLEKLDHGRNWIQKQWSGAGGKICLHEGIRRCQFQQGDAYLIEQVAQCQDWGTEFNDNIATTYDLLKQRFVEHREIMPEELYVTFGPQWRQIVTLVRQAATLDVSSLTHLIVLVEDKSREVNRDLSSAYSTLQAVYLDANRYLGFSDKAPCETATSNAIFHSLIVLGRDITMKANTQNLLAETAWRTAFAIVIRDKVVTGHTREKYDRLVANWEAVMGPIDYVLTGAPQNVDSA